MAHFAVSPSVIESVESQVPYGQQSSVRKFVGEAVNAVSEPKMAMAGKVALIVTRKQSILLDHALKSLGVALRKVSSLQAAKMVKGGVDFVIICADVAQTARADELEGLRRSSDTFGILAMGRRARLLIEAGLVDEAVSASALDKQIYDALAGAEAKGRIASMNEQTSMPRLSVFNQPAKRRYQIFGSA